MEKRLAFGPLAGLRGRLQGATAGDPGSGRLGAPEPPWPDVLITSGKRSLPVARWIRRQSGGRTRLVQLGRPGGPFALFDLIVATPDDRLPIRANVLQVAAPLAEAAAADDRRGTAASTARPATALLLSADSASPIVLERSRRARDLGSAAAAEAARHGGSLVVAADPGPTRRNW